MKALRVLVALEMPELEGEIAAGRITHKDADRTIEAAGHDLENGIKAGNTSFEYAIVLRRPWNRV